MPKDATPYNLTVPAAIPYLREQLAKMKAETNRTQLKGISPDDAFEMGYALAIRDVEHYTGPSPAEEHNDAVARVAEMEKKP